MHAVPRGSGNQISGALGGGSCGSHKAVRQCPPPRGAAPVGL